jgi:hypothetical protein
MGLKDKLNAAKDRVEAARQTQAAKLLETKLIADLGGRGEKLLAKNLEPNERILAKVKGDFGQAFVVTNRHMFIVKWGFQSGSTFGGKCIAFTYPNVTGLQIKQQALKCLVQVLTPATQDSNKLSYWGGRGSANNAIESDSAVTYSRAEGVLFQEAVKLGRQMMAKAHGGNLNADDDVAQLEKLAELKNKGVITEQEFKAKKRQILGL